MNKIKIVKRYVSKSELKMVFDYQRGLARKENRLVLKVEAVDTSSFFRTNKNAAKALFKDWAYPKVGDYIVIVHYCMDVCLANRKRSIKEKVKKAVRLNKVEETFFIVRLDGKKKRMMQVAALNFTTNFSIPVYKFRHYSTITSKKHARFEIPHPTSYYRFAA